MPPRKKQKKEENGQSSENGSPDFCYWLMKSEPESRIEKGVEVKFGIDDLQECPNQTDCWDGVRNYQVSRRCNLCFNTFDIAVDLSNARNFMKSMKLGQKAFFYHSNCKVPGIAGIIEIVKESYPDHTQFDKKDIHYDSSAKQDNPRWFMVDVKFVRKTKRYISLPELKSIHQEHKANGGPLAKVALFTRARLSVQPLTKDEWAYIIDLENKEPGKD